MIGLSGLLLSQTASYAGDCGATSNCNKVEPTRPCSTLDSVTGGEAGIPQETTKYTQKTCVDCDGDCKGQYFRVREKQYLCTTEFGSSYWGSTYETEGDSQGRCNAHR